MTSERELKPAKIISKAYALVREWQRRNPEKLKAHQILSWAVQSKKIIRPNRCSKCNKSSSLGIIQAHHSDYSKPLDVIWLCCTCHRGAHRKKFCIHGHKLDAENIYIRLDRGTRSCKKCANNATKRYQKKMEIKNVRGEMNLHNMTSGGNQCPKCFKPYNYVGDVPQGGFPVGTEPYCVCGTIICPKCGQRHVCKHD